MQNKGVAKAGSTFFAEQKYPMQSLISHTTLSFIFNNNSTTKLVVYTVFIIFCLEYSKQIIIICYQYGSVPNGLSQSACIYIFAKHQQNISKTLTKFNLALKRYAVVVLKS